MTLTIIEGQIAAKIHFDTDITSDDPYLTPTYTIFSLLHVSPSGKRPAWAKPKIWPIRKDFMIANRNSES